MSDLPKDIDALIESVWARVSKRPQIHSVTVHPDGSRVVRDETGALVSVWNFRTLVRLKLHTHDRRTK